ncbi:MAG TPA: FAD-dependent monooxygenase [Burkholderiales bacterium]|nr:FAD-dependent monooxygenase [Burkholderiales bacterium]
MTESADIVIVGGGPVGAALALALQPSGLDVLSLEARTPEAAALVADDRPLALSHGSRLILERLDVWGALVSATPITRIHVSQAGGFGRVLLDAHDEGLPAYGYVVPYAELLRALTQAAQQRVPRYRLGARVTGIAGEGASAVVEYARDSGLTDTASAPLAVVADGGSLVAGVDMRSRDYGQTAVTARVRAELAHGGTAYERFTRHGPLALLPMGRDMALIWTTTPERAVELSALNERGFLAALQGEFGGRLGAFVSAKGRSLYPLTLKYARHIVLPRTILIGNAAQTLHPVAGQGFNLGLRDAWELGEELTACEPEWLVQPEMLERVRRHRQIDRAASIRFTDTLVRVFSNDVTPARWARGAALAALDQLPPLKSFLARRMTFGARG